MRDSIYLRVGHSLRSSSGTWYQCIQKLAIGGNSATYLVYATSGPSKGTLFALKIFRRLSDPKRRDAFLKEVKFLIGCIHPSVMRVFDTGLFGVTIAGEQSEYPFVIAEYLPTTLSEVIKARSATMPEKLSYSIQLLSALSFLNSLPKPVVHRDIKPHNILIKGQSCILADFGLMKVLDTSDEPGRSIFKESVGLGMPFYYRTPDLVDYVLNKSSITTKSDVFQLGLVLAEVFTGFNPCAPSKDALAPVVLKPIRVIHGSFSKRIKLLIEKMLIFDPSHRPNASDLMDGWSGVFQAAIKVASRLEGYAFKS